MRRDWGISSRKTAILWLALLSICFQGYACVAEHPPDQDVMSTDDVTGPEPLLTLGTNVPGASEYDSFEMLEDGDELEIVFGHQGLWMVVLAIRTEGLDADIADVQGDLHVEGDLVGSLSLKRQRLKVAADGSRYLLNFFLVLDTPSQGGAEGRVTLTVTPEDAQPFSLTQAAQLVGGPSP